MQSYMTRHPEAKLTPIFLNGSQPAPARIFAERQLQLMQARCVLMHCLTTTSMLVSTPVAVRHLNRSCCRIIQVICRVPRVPLA